MRSPAPDSAERGADDSGSQRRPSPRRAPQGGKRRKRPPQASAATAAADAAEPRIWTCASCGGETDVRESMARCSHCGATQWGSYLLLPLFGALLLLATLIAVPLRETLPVFASVAKWVGLVAGTFVSWLGWYILVLDLTKDRVVLVWLITLVLGTVAVLIARFL